MGEYKDSSIWMKVSVLMLALGFFCLGIGFATGTADQSPLNSGGVAFLVIGFLCFLTALVLVLCLVFLDELKGNKPALICLVVFALIAGLATIIGVAINHGTQNRYLGGNSNSYNSGSRSLFIQTSYASMYDVMAGLMAILAGIFGILELVGVSAP